MLSSLIRLTLLGWNGSFVGKKRKEVWRASPLCILWAVWRQGIEFAFEDNILSIQRLKSSFVCFIWPETEKFIKDGPLTLIGFIDWLASH